MTTSKHTPHAFVRKALGRIAARRGGCCQPEGNLVPAPGPASTEPKTGVEVQVFDPAMCCSTGVCGTTVDPRLVRFSADLEWLKAQGATVTRFNLAQQALAFTGDDEVKAALQAKGEGALPLVKVDGKVQSVGGYPTRDQLAAWAGLGAPERFLDEDKKSRSAEAEPESKPSAGCCGGTGATPDCCG